MSALSDAVDAVVAEQAKIETDIQAVLALLKQPNPDIDAAVTKLQGLLTAQETSATELEGAVPPTPPA